MSRSRRGLKARRGLASEGFLPRVIIGSATRRSSFALGRGVLISSWRRSETVMLRSIASRWLVVRLSFLSPWPWRMVCSLACSCCLGAVLEAGGRPVLELHAEGEAARGEDFLDLVERLAAQVRGLQELGLAALDQVADVIDVLGLEAVGGAHGELEVVDRAQQDRIHGGGLRLLGGHRGAFERSEHGGLVDP